MSNCMSVLVDFRPYFPPKQECIILSKAVVTSDGLTILETVANMIIAALNSRMQQMTILSKAVVTSDGLTILEAVSLSHPVANMIVAALKKCHAVTYDGSKTFLLLVKFLLKHLVLSINHGKFTEKGTYNHFTNSSAYKHSKISASKSLSSFANEILPEVCMKMINLELIKQYRSGNVHGLMKKVCQATLLPHFNQRQCRYFADILVKIFGEATTIQSVREILQLMTRKFNQLCVKVSGRNYMEGTILEPLLLRRSKNFKNLLTKGKGNSVKAICLQISDENSDDEDPDVGINIKDPSQIHDSLQIRRKSVKQFAEACVKSEISLIICSNSPPDYLVSILHQYKLTVLTNVYKEDIDLLELFTHTTSVTSLQVQGHVEEINIVNFTSLEEVTIGSEQFIHVKSDKFHFKHVIICAPSPGLCDQTALLLQKAVNAMFLSLEDVSFQGDLLMNSLSKSRLCRQRSACIDMQADLAQHCLQMDSYCTVSSPNLKNKTDLQEKNISSAENLDKVRECNVIPVGGVFELMMSELLIDKSKSISDPQIKELCLILSEALVDVIKVLFENRRSVVNQHGSRFIDVKLQMINSMKEGKIGGLNIDGKFCGDETEVLLEPVILKIHVLQSVLNLLSQLLRVDGLIPVKKLEPL